MFGMSALGERLKRARELAGFAEATAAATAHGWTVPTYLSHENGSRGVPLGKLPAYAAAFRVSLEWLATGQGSPRDGSDGADSFTPPPSNVGAMREAPAVATWPRDLPVYGTALGGSENHGTFQLNVGDTIDHI